LDPGISEWGNPHGDHSHVPYSEYIAVEEADPGN
jgi:hypothetical protein